MNVPDHPLHRLPKYGDGIGLHRVRFLMESCGIDADAVSRKAIAVTGSNGKGSTASIASALLEETGGTTGLFTSPHLYRYNERFRLNGVPIADDALLAAMDKVERAVAAYRASHKDAVGAFEAQFVVALVALHDCRWLLLEAGIGGRYDPVRLAQAPVIGLVSLDLEHTELLGASLLEIACDKLDAAVPGGLAILGETCLPLAEQIRAYAALTKIELEFVTPGSWTDNGVENNRQLFEIGTMDGTLRSRLIGRHQINNHAVAIALVRARLKRSSLAQPSEIRRRDAIARVDWPGRLEAISTDPHVVIDVGHTPEGIKAALAGYRALSAGRNSVLVTGGSKNKHVREMLERLVPEFDRIVCTAAYHNGLAATEIFNLVREIHPQAQTTLAPTIEEAVAAARAIAIAQSRDVYVAGGLFLAAEFAECWRGHNPRALRFF